jgi:serine/threonine-protein kinase
MDKPEIPGYEILEALPRGNMSVVFKARQLSLNRIVALKTLHCDLARGTADIEQFLAEARLTANLNHPNIVRVYDFGKSEDGVYYFAMHYVTGYTIGSWIRRKGFLSETDTLLAAQTVAEALN